jgi:hypothetical protein
MAYVVIDGNKDQSQFVNYIYMCVCGVKVNFWSLHLHKII